MVKLLLSLRSFWHGVLGLQQMVDRVTKPVPQRLRAPFDGGALGFDGAGLGVMVPFRLVQGGLCLGDSLLAALPLLAKPDFPKLPVTSRRLP